MRANNFRVLGVVALLGVCSTAWADIIIQTGPVTVRVGNGVSVDVHPRPRMLVPTMPTAPTGPSVEPPPGVPLEIAPPAPPVPLPGNGTPRTVGQPMTIYEFAGCFKPTPGTHEMVLLHPYSGCPVKVSFCLPEGCPTVKVKGGLRRCIEFSYGKRDIEVWFYRDGRVKVNN